MYHKGQDKTHTPNVRKEWKISCFLLNESEMTGKEWNKVNKMAAARLSCEKLYGAAGQQSSSGIDGLVHRARIGSELLSNIEGWPAGLKLLAKLAKLDVRALVKYIERVKLPEKLSFEGISGLSALMSLSQKEFEVNLDEKESTRLLGKNFIAVGQGISNCNEAFYNEILFF